MTRSELTTELQSALLARKAELTADLHHIEDVLDEPAPRGVEDAAVERQGDEVMEALGRAEVAELRMIDAALTRIEEDSYGACIKCGEDIAEARLKLLPATPMCRACAG